MPNPRAKRQEEAARDVGPVWQKDASGEWVQVHPTTNQPTPAEPGNNESEQA